MPISIRVNEYLFMSYVGLVASSYELSDKNDTEIMRLVDDIRNTSFKDSAVEYFKKARSTNVINPYWPYGSDISAACFFIKDYKFNTFDDYVAFIKSCGFGGHEGWFWDWIKELPDVLRQIKENPGYSRLWKSKQEKAQYCKWSCDSGFLFVSEVLKAMDKMDVTEDNLGDFIQQVMESECVK